MMSSLELDQARERFSLLRAEAHPSCFVCGDTNAAGLGVRFELQADGTIAGRFLPRTELQGYPGLLHGGLAAALLDGAMTQCLFARGLKALTVELRVRYHKPVEIGREIRLRAWLENQMHGLYELRAELLQADEVKAGATAKFMESPDGAVFKD